MGRQKTTTDQPAPTKEKGACLATKGSGACTLVGGSRNRIASTSRRGKPPFEMSTGRKPNVSHMRPFGSLCWAVKSDACEAQGMFHHNLDQSAEAQHGYNFGNALERAGLSAAYGHDTPYPTRGSPNEIPQAGGSIGHRMLRA